VAAVEGITDAEAVETLEKALATKPVRASRSTPEPMFSDEALNDDMDDSEAA